MDSIIISILVVLSVTGFGIIIGVLKYVVINRKNKAKKSKTKTIFEALVENTEIKSCGRVAFIADIVNKPTIVSTRKNSKSNKRIMTDMEKNIEIEYKVKPAYSQYSTKEKSVA